MHLGTTSLAIALLVVSLFLGGLFTDKPPAPVDTPARVVIISPKQRTHILYGDERGGGHFHTANKPCKSEFPKDWEQKKIIETIEMVAANDNLAWKRASNGYFTAEQTVGDLRIRVVLAADKMKVITAYPVNVPRNPCPANDNKKR